MKDYILNIANSKEDKTKRLNVLREYLQMHALRSLHESGYFKNLIFVGGTCLRFVHDLPRYSEDLDFSLLSKKGYDFEKYLKTVEKDFRKANYEISIKYKMQKTVQTAHLKFPELLFKSDLSDRMEKNLMIKFDVDSNPPAGGVAKTTLVNKYFPVSIRHYDLPSLFSGKLHAILTRPYVKGRDYFDLVWILSRWKDIVPNMILLRNALKQTGNDASINEKNWKERVWEKTKSVDWKTVLHDIESFVEDPHFVSSIEPDNLKELLGGG